MRRLVLLLILLLSAPAFAEKPVNAGKVVGYLTKVASIHSFDAASNSFSFGCNMPPTKAMYATTLRVPMNAYNASRKKDFYPIASPCRKVTGAIGYVLRTNMSIRKVAAPNAEDRAAKAMANNARRFLKDQKRAAARQKPQRIENEGFDQQVHAEMQRLSRPIGLTLAMSQLRRSNPRQFWAEIRKRAVATIRVRNAKGKVKVNSDELRQAAIVLNQNKNVLQTQALDKADQAREKEEEEQRGLNIEKEAQAHMQRETKKREAAAAREREKNERDTYLASLQQGAGTPTDTAGNSTTVKGSSGGVKTVPNSSVGREVANNTVRFLTALVTPVYLWAMLTVPAGQTITKGIWVAFARLRLQVLFTICSGIAPIIAGIALSNLLFELSVLTEAWFWTMVVLLSSITFVAAALRGISK